MMFDMSARLVSAAFPSFAERHGTAPHDASELLSKIGWLSAGLASLAAVGIGLWLPAFVKLWLGADYALPDGRSVAMAFGSLVAIRTFGNLLGMFWLSSGDARFGAVLAWIQAVLKVGTGVILVGPLGIAGLAIASLLASSLQVIGLSTMLYRRGLLDLRALLNWGILIVGAVVVAGVGFRPNAGSTILGFGLWTVLTAVVWSSLWLWRAWHGALRPFFLRVLGSKCAAR
jgi:O-antigen/teichoic acid export membrane protein